MLRFWNTATRSLEEFKPIQPQKIGLYTCGPTVYNPLTIGNWRAFLFDDTLKRALRFLGYRVIHVLNITDVGHLVGDGDMGEDKIEKEANKTGKNAWEVVKGYEESFRREMKLINISDDVGDTDMRMPRATEHINEQIEIVNLLEEKGYTYRTSDGIYFDTAKFPSYGKLSGQRLEDKQEGARVEVNEEKHQSSDFVLWKFSPTDKKRHMEWESPWGIGAPGWHIECSAMARKYLGQPFDIHCGGVDHIAVHHENEIAQSEAAFGVPLAHYWMHNEFLLIDGGRMGKSLGNAYTMQDLIAHGFDPIVYRMFVLGAHYRSKINFTWEALEGAKHALQNLKKAFLSWENEETVVAEAHLKSFQEALEEDLNTPKALALMWEVVKSDISASEKRATLLKVDEVLGLGMKDWKEEIVEIPSDIQALAEERWQARLAKNWAESDRLREVLAESGWMMQDGSGGYTIVKI